MKREILFKGKRLDTGEWVEGDLIHHNEQTLIHPKFEYPYQYDKEDLNVNPETVCQYTGLKDKNGNRIWEGDRVVVPNDEGIDADQNSKWLVIGNIHDKKTEA